jgi:peroxiredoxin
MIKRSLSVLAACVMSLTAMAQAPFTIKGKLGNLQAPAKVYIGYSVDGKRIFDSADVNNGTFEMMHYTNYPVCAIFSVSKDGEPKSFFDGNNIARLYVEPGATIWLTSNEDIVNFESSGSKTQEDYKVFQNYMAPVEAKLNALTVEGSSSNAKKDTAARRNYMERFRAAMNEKRKMMKEFVMTYRDMYICLDILEEYAGHFIDYQDVEPAYMALSDRTQQTIRGKAFLKKLNEFKTTAVGTTAPDFTQKDVDGNKVTLSSLKGKHVLLVFWASWSPTSRADNLELKEMLKGFKGKNLTVIGIGMEERKDSWVEAIQQDGISWLQLSDLKYMKNEVAGLYDVTSVPQNVLIDPAGNIVSRNLKGSALKDKLTSVLAQ